QEPWAGCPEEQDQHDQGAEGESLLEPDLPCRGRTRSRGRRSLLLSSHHRTGSAITHAETPSAATKLVASSMILLRLASYLVSSHFTRPLAITTMRCESRSTSGSSLEITMIDFPEAARSCRRR